MAAVPILAGLGAGYALNSIGNKLLPGRAHFVPIESSKEPNRPHGHAGPVVRTKRLKLDGGPADS